MNGRRHKIRRAVSFATVAAVVFMLFTSGLNTYWHFGWARGCDCLAVVAEVGCASEICCEGDNLKNADCCSPVSLPDETPQCCDASAGTGCCLYTAQLCDFSNITLATQFAVAYEFINPSNPLEFIFKPPKV